MNTKTTINWKNYENDLLNARFVANYKGYSHLSDYFRYLIKIGTNKEINRIRENVHNQFKVIQVEPEVQIVSTEGDSV